MVFNNPVGYVDSFGLWTLQIGVSVTGGGGVGGTAGIGIAMSFSDAGGFQFGTYGMAGMGSYIGVGASATVDISMSANACLSDLEGSALTGGGSGNIPPVAGGNAGAEGSLPISGDNAGNPAAGTFTVSGGVGVGSPGEGHVFVTHTQILTSPAGNSYCPYY